MMPIKNTEWITEDGVHHTLASPGKRIIAAAINFGLAYILWTLAVFIFPEEDNPTMPLATLAVYGFIQVWLMSAKGQSVGKYLMKIKVIDKNGSNPGGMGTVLAREVLFRYLRFKPPALAG